MKFGFIIDNRKCIGCHACTTACKSEHDVPVGVNRTYVKQVEKGLFPDTKRIFSVMRCNHCTDAPCVEICPVEALYIREDGIVDFDNNRCIGCKSCMQACPYDALYIDPETHTAAKCNYCAHRVDVGREPACVSVCPEHAIIAGDMENANTEIAKLLAEHDVKVRNPEKGTRPNVFYIDGDAASLIPDATHPSGPGLWNSQSRGVGHFAKAAEKMINTNDDIDLLQMSIDNEIEAAYQVKEKDNPNYIDVLSGKARRVYDTPDKGILWGWEVSAYVLTKAVAAGAFLLPFLGYLLGYELSTATKLWSAGIALVFLGLTGLFLVMDLDRPDRFLYVLLRPQWKSWLVKGGYTITIFGLLMTLWGVATYFDWAIPEAVFMWVTAVFAIVLAIYTAFLFAQAKGRDFWQSPSLGLHMLIHSLMAGTAIFTLISSIVELGNWVDILGTIMPIAIGINLLIILFELFAAKHSPAAKTVVEMITKGRYKNTFLLGAVAIGNLLPLIIFLLTDGNLLSMIASVMLLIGIYITEKIWVEAPQRVPLA